MDFTNILKGRVAESLLATLLERAGYRVAVVVSDPGEIYDFEYTPPAAEELTLRFGPVPPPPAPLAAGPPPPPTPPPPSDSAAPPAPAPPPPTVSVAVHVR
jgi:hypothetical protein